ncbi:MAG: winged helix-turn-helix transcriptional regulator [Chromatiaceae bacterium]|nr:winged helix-turn-helix transcriptional regulator [Chromatiaceae bacterium]
MSEAQTEQLTRVVVSIFRTYGRLIDWGDQFAAPFGLTSARWQMLGALAFLQQPASAPAIARQMGVTRQGANKQLALLEKQGLVRKGANPAHKRSPLFALTEDGQRCYRAIQAAWETHARALGEAISAEDLAATLRTLQTLTQLHQATEENPDDAV